MITAVPRARWLAVRASVRAAGDRFAELVRSAPDPRAGATRHWSIVDTAAHVASISGMYTSLIRPDTAESVAGRLAAVRVDTIAAMNDRLLGRFTERDPQVLAARIRADIDTMLRASADLDPAGLLPWLGEARLPRAGLLAHLTNELLIHGRDIAHAVGVPWPIAPEDAAQFFDFFLVGVSRHGIGRLLDRHPPPRRRIAVEFRSRYTDAVTMVLRHGRVLVEEPGGPTDVRIRFDPVTMNLLLFHRINPLRALLTGGVSVSGPRPWLLPRFMRTVRLP